MLRKLIKQEFRATGRIGLPLCLGMVALSVLAAIAIPLLERYSSGLVSTVATIVIMLYMMGFFALIIGILVVVVDRFYRSVLRDEGYLTMTLPVSLGQLLSARLICALLWYLIAAAIMCVAVLLIFVGQINWADSAREIGDLFTVLWTKLPELRGGDVFWFVSLALELVVCAVLACLQVTLHFYAAAAIGHSFARSKMLLSVIAFFLLSWALSAAGFAALRIAGNGAFPFYNAELLSGHWGPHIALGFTSGALLAADAALYAISYLCLKFKLNLE